MRAVLAMALVLASVALSSRAQADTEAAKKEAQALQVQGLRLLQKGENRAALEKFDEAFRLVASPKILFNRGKAHRALGENAEALADFERFLDEAPYATKESRVEATRIVEALRPTLAYVEVQTDDVGSRITIDGRELGTAPLPRPAVVTPGNHEIRVAKAGMAEDVRTVSPIAGQKLRVAVKLLPAAPAAAAPVAVVPAAAPEPAAPPTVFPAAPSPPKDTAEPPPASAGRPWQITAAWVAAGAGVVLLGGGIAAQVVSASKASDFNAVPNMMCNRKLPDDGGGMCKELGESIDRWRAISIAGYVTAGLALAGSAVLFLTAPSRAPAGRDMAVACLPNETLGVACALTTRF
jgi:hypothetical protein